MVLSTLGNVLEQFQSKHFHQMAMDCSIWSEMFGNGFQIGMQMILFGNLLELMFPPRELVK